MTAHFHKTIAILFHEAQAAAEIHNYLITYYAKIWQSCGARIVLLLGIGKFVPADLIVVHVDLSVVPEEYLTFAARYPIAVNGQVRDIRKSAISQNLLTQGCDYRGPVIVKSDCNYAALPEKQLYPNALNLAEQLFKSPLGYKVYEDFSQVPEPLTRMPGIVIEKFLPEIKNGLYHVRFYNFLGNKGNCMRIAATAPVVHISHAVAVEQIPFDPRIEQLRRAYNFDYGKFDYVERDGQIILFDANKTTGFVGGGDDPVLQQVRLERAMGIFDYFV